MDFACRWVYCLMLVSLGFGIWFEFRCGFVAVLWVWAFCCLVLAFAWLGLICVWNCFDLYGGLSWLPTLVI